MKRSHNYSSSDSDLDDNVDVEKDSGDENGYVCIFSALLSFHSIVCLLMTFVSL